MSACHFELSCLTAHMQLHKAAIGVEFLRTSQLLWSVWEITALYCLYSLRQARPNFSKHRVFIPRMQPQSFIVTIWWKLTEFLKSPKIAYNCLISGHKFQKSLGVQKILVNKIWFNPPRRGPKTRKNCTNQ